MTAPTTYIIGAGLAGLAAATRLAERGRRICLIEAAPNAGGRCRSFNDKYLGRDIDNGNHLILSGNRDAIGYLERIDATGTIIIGKPRFPFRDVASGESWTVELSKGPIPWWLLKPSKRVPGTRLIDYWRSKSLFDADRSTTVEAALLETGTLYERFWKPFSIAVLNTIPEEASASLLIPVIRETLGKGGGRSAPVFAKQGLGFSFVDPALTYLRRRGADIRFGQRCSALRISDENVKSIALAGSSIDIAADDTVILAVPASVAGDLLPTIEAPSAFRSILNVHFKIEGLGPQEPITGLFGCLAEWLFVRGDVASVTVSAADRWRDTSSDELAARIWREIASTLGRPENPIPAYRVIFEKRATFAQTPEMVVKRPDVRTGWKNLYLAGDWTDTGLPATIEGAIRSGHGAASCVLNG